MASVPKFRIDVDIHNLLMNSAPGPVVVPPPKGMKLPEPVFPRFPEKLSDPGPAVIPDKRDPADLSHHARLALSLYSLSCVAGRFPSHHRVSFR